MITVSVEQCPATVPARPQEDLVTEQFGQAAKLEETVAEQVQDSDIATRARVGGGVVVGHDGSGCASEALAWAAGLAERARWPLHVVRAWRIATAPQPKTWEPGYVPPISYH